MKLRFFKVDILLLESDQTPDEAGFELVADSYIDIDEKTVKSFGIESLRDDDAVPVYKNHLSDVPTINPCRSFHTYFESVFGIDEVGGNFKVYARNVS